MACLCLAWGFQAALAGPIAFPSPRETAYPWCQGFE